jgi:hypothetical protein
MKNFFFYLEVNILLYKASHKTEYSSHVGKPLLEASGGRRQIRLYIIKTLIGETILRPQEIKTTCSPCSI